MILNCSGTNVVYESDQVTKGLIQYNIFVCNIPNYLCYVSIMYHENRVLGDDVNPP